MSKQKNNPGATDEIRPSPPVTRRRFMLFLQFLGIGTFLGSKPLSGQKAPPQSSPATANRTLNDARRAHLSRVIHVHSESATFWDYATTWYGDHVNQAAVDAMTVEGLLQLTRSATVVQAWQRLIPDHAPGRKFAIKVNLNNFVTGDPDPDPEINALIEVVNSVVGTLVQFGVAPADITVYDVTHGGHESAIPQISFASRCLYPGVGFVAYCGNPDPYSATQKVSFDCPPPPKPQIPDCAICNALVDSDYLINIPIVKYHLGAYVTLGFKNHFGSINRCDRLHVYSPLVPDYTPEYSPVLDIYRNPHFGAKTVLTIGDCLFGLWHDQSIDGVPRRWITFGDGAPNSLFFGVDPVALDSVMADFVDAERRRQGLGHLPVETRDYLILAEKAGLGTFETGNPWNQPPGGGYGRIRYRVREV